MTLTFFYLIFLLPAIGQLKIQGIFVGLEPMKDYTDAFHPKHKWYHLSVLTFKGDSVFLEQSTVAIYKNDTIFSASDGGFYYYAGTLVRYYGKTFADLKLTSCDYCPNQFIKFTPPKIVNDEEATQLIPTDTPSIKEPMLVENFNIKSKLMLIKKCNSKSIKVDRNIYRRKKQKIIIQDSFTAFPLAAHL